MTVSYFAKFRRGRINFSDEFRDGHPSTVINNVVCRMIKTDGYMYYHEIRVGTLRHRHESDTINPTKTFEWEKTFSDGALTI